MFNLYDFQAKGVEEIRAAFSAGYRSPLYCAPTGSGKTVVFSHISEGVVAKQNRAIILVHRYELLKQTSDALQEAGVLHGLIHPRFRPTPYAPIQVASVQTMLNRLTKIDREFDLVVIDEAHHAAAKSWLTIVGNMPNSRLLGVTATPIRTDGKGLGKQHGGLFDTLIKGPQIKELIEWGYLKKPKVFGSGEIIDLVGVKMVRGDYEKAELERRLNRKTITGNAVMEYRRLCPGLPAIAFCVSVKHAEEVAHEFCQAGFNFASIDGKMSDADRARRIAGLADGTFHGLTSCELISEGTDIPAVAVCIGLRPTNSLSLYLQMSGRPLRKYPGQEIAYILDHAGNVFRHGMPDADREWSLDGSYAYEPNTGGTSPRSKLMQCKKCRAIVANANTCSECGNAHIQARPLLVKNGMLVEVNEEQLNALNQVENKIAPTVKTLAEFELIALQNKYKKGWAHYMFKAQNKKQKLA